MKKKKIGAYCLAPRADSYSREATPEDAGVGSHLQPPTETSNRDSRGWDYVAQSDSGRLCLSKTDSTVEGD